MAELSGNIERKTTTVADFIRAMNDEELAYFIKFIVSQAQIYGMAYVTKRLEWIDWLKQPAEQKVIKNYKKVVDKQAGV